MNTMTYYLWGIKAPQKYASLFHTLLETPEIEVVNYVSDNASFLPAAFKFPFQKNLSLATCRYVLRRNGISPKQMKTITKVNEVNEDDVVVAFVHTKEGCADIDKFCCKKVVHLNQFGAHNISELNQYLPSANDFLLEANVLQEGNYLMQASLPQHPHITIIPYVVGERFVKEVPFEGRIRKAVATGTIAGFPDDQTDYTSFYKTRLLHKMRQVIYDHQSELSGLLDSYLSPYREGSKVLSIKKDGNSLINSIKYLYNMVIARNGRQKAYFSFNIVDKYNEYQMAVVPEEITGIPAIGAFEAMACGCAFIGLDHTMYTDLGLIPCVHYIAYDGSLDDLKRKISYYQGHEEELFTIAENGYNFVKQHFDRISIANLFIRSV